MVIGAGAAGLMAALHAGRAGADVVLVERTADGGRKILISGGGRCNVLPGRAEPGRYVTDSSPNTLRRMLASWPLEEQRAFFEHELGMAMVLEEETGKLFPASNRARDVRDGLVAAVRAGGVRTWFGSSVVGLAQEAESWVVSVTPDAADERGPTTGPREHQVAAVVLATGGLSVPRTGSDGTGLKLVEALGHTVHATYPALTPLTAEPPPHKELAGISLVVRLNAPGARPRFTTTDGFLFTHRGWSGPAVLDASHLAVRSAMTGEHQQLRVRWVPELDRQAWDTLLRADGTGSVAATVERHLPTRLARRLLAEAALPAERRRSELRREERLALLTVLAEYPLPWTGDEGYKKAEVTGGGVALEEVDPGTLESRRRPGLFLCGELLDAFGPIGGHNFLWAWATGRAAGRGAAKHAGAQGGA